jgi:hypothetical protein
MTCFLKALAVDRGLKLTVKAPMSYGKGTHELR